MNSYEKERIELLEDLIENYKKQVEEQKEIIRQQDELLNAYREKCDAIINGFVDLGIINKEAI